MTQPWVPFNEVTMMNNMRNAHLGLWLVILAVVSCGFPRLSELASGDANTDGSGNIDGSGGTDGGGGGDDATSDGGPLHLSLELLAGDIGGSGNGDGTGATARFNRPHGVAVDSVGNVYVADEFNHTIRKVTVAGVVATVAGTAGMPGSADGTGAAARFNAPRGIAVDSAGNVYIADESNHTIRKITADGVVTTLAGTAGVSGSQDGTGVAARFNLPSDVAVDSTGNIYVADESNRIIRKINASGVVTTLAGAAGMSGSTDGTGAAARFSGPCGVAADGAGNIYAADFFNETIRKVTPAGVVTTLAGMAGMPGSADGAGAAARFSGPCGVEVDSVGNVYVADHDNNTLRKVTAAGVVTTLAGTAGTFGNADGTGAAARFNTPRGVAVDSTGNVYVADFSNSTIRKVTVSGVVTTLAGTAGTFGSANGTGAAARFSTPRGVAVDSFGNVYVADQNNHTIRKITSAGGVTTLAGIAGMPGSSDGTGAAGRFNRPSGVAVDSAGNVYVADQNNHTIRKITSAGVVTTLVGTAGMPGSSDGTRAAARFNLPIDVAIDSVGNAYVADQNNHTIRKVTPAGVVTTLAGTAGMSGSANGTGAAAGFSRPAGVAVDSTGNVYVADQNNSAIRKVTAGGVVTTLSGTAGMPGSVDGTGAAACFDHPPDVAVDSIGNAYVADQSNSTIRKVTPTGITTTVAGTAGVVGILLGATPRLAFPQSLVIVGDSIVISDANAILFLRHGAQ